MVAANHPSYLDPILLSLQVRRPIRFMAWDKLFKVPLLGAFLRAFDAFPVDVRPGHGREAYARARSLIEAGEVVGIFPEGRRSRTGWMEPTLREGAARLAWETGAPLVPATIAGAFRVWPHFQSLPRPARVRVRYHAPIDPAPWRGRPEGEALPALLDELRRRVDRSLLPGVKADLRTSVLYGAPPPPPRLSEVVPAALFAVLAAARGGVATAWPFAAYVIYLLLDWKVLAPSRLLKWARNAAGPLVLLGWAPSVLAALELPRPPAAAALAAVVLGAWFPYLSEHRRNVRGVTRGLVACVLLEMGALALAPAAAGPHLALPLFLALFAAARKTVFSRYAVPVLALYALLVPLALGARVPDLALHAAAAALSAVVFGYRWRR